MDERQALRDQIELLTRELEQAQAVIATMRDQLYAREVQETEKV